MTIPLLLFVALLAAPVPNEASPLRAQSEEFAAAFEAGDVGRLMRLWSDQSPTRNADRRRLNDILPDRTIFRLGVEVDEPRGVVRLEIRDRAQAVMERYELRFQREGNAWRAWSLTPVETSEPVPLARELIHRGHAHLDTGELDEAFANYKRAAEVADTTDHAATRAAAQRALGNVAFAREDIEAATRHFENSLAITKAANLPREVGKSLDRLGVVDRIKGDYPAAEAKWNEALQIFRASGDPALEARAHNALGNMRSGQGDFAGGKLHFEESLRIYERLGNAHGMSTVLNNLGADQRAQGRYRDAVALFLRSMEISRSVDDVEGVAYALGNLGNAYTALGEFADALHAFRQGLALQEKLGSGDALVNSHIGIGEIYRGLGNLELARAEFERALAIAEKIGWKESTAIVLHNLGQVALQAGDPRRALQLYESGLKLDTELGNRTGIAMGLHNMGRAHLRAGDRDAARRSFDTSLAIAEEIGNREVMVLNLTQQANVAEDPAQSLKLAERARALATELGLNEPLWETHSLLARVHRRAGRLDDARREAGRAVAYVEELRRGVPGDELAQQAFESYVRSYHQLIAIQIEQHDVAGALENAERAKARVLLDVLRHGRPDFHGALTPVEREREAALLAEVVQANNELRAALGGGAGPSMPEKLRKARLDYDAFLTGLYAAHPQLRMERGDITPVRSAEIAELLAAGEAGAFLEFVVTDERTYLFSITRGGNGLDLRVHPVAMTRRELEAEVLRFRKLLAERDVTYAATARSLYDRLIAPAAVQLRGKETIAIVPDGPLWELPFQALQSAPSEFLLDRHTLYSVPSLTVLRDMTRTRAPRGGAVRLLAFGNPVLQGIDVSRTRGEALAPLPQTESEIRAIAALYGPSNTRVHLGADAREELVKAEAAHYDVLHFATHGLLDDHNALYSRLVFSPPVSKSEDGLLEAREIMRLELRAGLAVLSACETARGRVGAGEGLIGMSWALFVAGVPTGVVSQWKVDSASTAELMVDFHRNLRASRNTTVAQALRRAALKTRANPAYRHPFYWAPFVVVGSAR